jgi:hypothetical protein
MEQDLENRKTEIMEATWEDERKEWRSRLFLNSLEPFIEVLPPIKLKKKHELFGWGVTPLGREDDYFPRLSAEFKKV